MKSVDFYIYIFIALLGVAYPLLLQVIAKLDERYSSSSIVELFCEESEKKYFESFLYISFIYSVIWTLVKWIINLKLSDGFSCFINNCSVTWFVISVIALVISFFLFAKKIIIYYSPLKLVRHFKQKHSNSIYDFKYFRALSDMFFFSIRSHQICLSLQLSSFFYEAFENKRKKYCKNKPIVYPDQYYRMIYESTEELLIINEKRSDALESMIAGGILLLGDSPGTKISDKTYSWMWRNFLLIIQYNREDMIIYHWETACRHYAGTFSYYAVNKGNDDERKNFIDFHYALGGLLLYKQMYGCIGRLLSYTTSKSPTSQSPKGELLHEMMDNIFDSYFTFSKTSIWTGGCWVSRVCPFPNQSGLDSYEISKKWILLYVALLFLGQYKYNIGQLKNCPTLPEEQEEIEKWVDGIDSFKKMVSEHLNNESLLKELDLTFITNNWCSKNDIPYPTDFIDKFKQKLMKKSDQAQKEN